MKRMLLLIVISLGFSTPNIFATPATMRLDYYHSGKVGQETFSLDRIVVEPLPWPGDPGKNVDDSNLGNYFFEVDDTASGRTLYSRAFNSIYGEWITTDEAKSMDRTFSESLRFPAPTVPVHVLLKSRSAGESGFHEVWSVDINPHDKFIDTSRPPSPGPLLKIQQSGDSITKVDLLVLGDGYTAAERAKFEQDAHRFADMLFSTSPFREHRNDFNVWGLCPPADESGISRPSTGVHRRNPLGTTYDTFDTERYILTTNNRALRDVASYAPYEFIEILVNDQTYGGGGIFNLYATVAIDSEWAGYVGVHEFGHHFAALADEYYTSPVAYTPASQKSEPWEPNVTALLNPGKLKWRDLVAPGTPLPTPWRKDEFESYERDIQKQRRQLRAANRPESEMNNLFRHEAQREETLLKSDQYSGTVGAFEGADYEAHGYYRPEENCIMFTRYAQFCAVCRRAIERIIAMYAS
ncbi:MAG TPA: M64 family metallopeptidase [Terriglobales bacterium]|nr:M64 family metallopeptidase [Terriglobales bacterium]